MAKYQGGALAAAESILSAFAQSLNIALPKTHCKGTYQLRKQSLYLPPSFRFPPLREGNRAAHPLGSPRFARGTAQGFGSPCVQGEPYGGGCQLLFFCEHWLGDWRKPMWWIFDMPRGHLPFKSRRLNARGEPFRLCDHVS